MALLLFDDTLPEFRNPVLTIGSFDGVHIGHKKILERVVSEAEKIDGESIVITFDPHPRKILHPEKPLSLITSSEEKYKEIFNTGIHHIVVVPFSRDFSMMAAKSYIHDFLWEKFKPNIIIIGYDHQFGHDRTGNMKMMASELSGKCKIIEIPAKLIQDAAISSTKIRKAISSGQVSLAQKMLGRPFRIKGIVVHGRKLGRQLGFPTANLIISEKDKLLPPIGVYAVRVLVCGRFYNGAMSIGKNPTVSQGQTISYEVYILDFNEDIYGETLIVDFYLKIRDEIQFPDLESLKQQMHLDLEQVKKVLSSKN